MDRSFLAPLPQKEPVWINFIYSMLHNFFTYCGIRLQTAVCCEAGHRFLTYDQPSCELVCTSSSGNHYVDMAQTPISLFLLGCQDTVVQDTYVTLCKVRSDNHSSCCCWSECCRRGRLLVRCYPNCCIRRHVRPCCW